LRALASHQCVKGSIPGPGVINGLSLLLVLYSAPKGFSKFQFDLNVRHFSHEPLARVIAQALPVFDVKIQYFTFTAGDVSNSSTMLKIVKRRVLS